MILQKYIFKNIAIHLLLILCLLTAVFLVFAYFHFIREAASARLSSNDIAKILITEIPVLLQPILPLSLFLSILIVFRKLHGGNEILSMHAAGMSEMDVFTPILLICLLLTIFSAYMQLHIFPLANTKRIHLFEDSVHNLTFDKVFAKQFNQIKDSEVIYLDKKIDKTKVEGIFYSHISPDKNNELAYDIITAQSLEEKILPDKSKFVVFLKGVRYTSNVNSMKSLVIRFEKFGIRLTKPNYRLENWPGCMNTAALYFMSKKDKYAAAELHWRISIPISILNLTFFALAFYKDRIRGYVRPISALYPILVYLIYVNLLLVSVGLIKNEMLSKQMGLWYIHGAMFLFCIFTLRFKPR